MSSTKISLLIIYILLAEQHSYDSSFVFFPLSEFSHPTHLQTGVHLVPFLKHSQYFLLQPLLVQVQIIETVLTLLGTGVWCLLEEQFSGG